MSGYHYHYGCGLWLLAALGMTMVYLVLHPIPPSESQMSYRFLPTRPGAPGECQHRMVTWKEPG